MPALDGLRALASLHILIFHAVFTPHLPGSVRSAVAAVDTSTSFFLILSGTLMYLAFAEPSGELRGSRRQFFVGRLTRLLPLNIAGQVLALPPAIVSLGPGKALLLAAAGATGLHGWFPALKFSLNGAAWFVSSILLCYAVFPWLVRSASRMTGRAALGAVAVAWLLAILPGIVRIALHGPSPHGDSTHQYFPPARVAEFALGVYLAHYWRVRGVPSGRASMRLALLGSIGLGVGLLSWTSVPALGAFVGIFAPLHVLLLTGLASGAGPIARVLSWPPLLGVGRASIAIFLLHMPVLAWFFSLGLLSSGASWGMNALWTAIYLALCVALATVSTRWVFEPLSARLRGTLPHASRSPPASGS